MSTDILITERTRCPSSRKRILTRDLLGKTPHTVSSSLDIEVSSWHLITLGTCSRVEILSTANDSAQVLLFI